MSSVLPEIASGGGVVSQRAKAPVFVLGCVRSGTTLLYHMLLSAGGFAVYMTESNAINLLEPAFGDLARESNRQKLIEVWLKSKLFTRSGLDEREVREEIVRQSSDGGRFLSAVMNAMCRRQGVERWADCTPEHITCLRRIKQTIPNALIVHIIRDGRDVAVSLEKQQWVAALPWDRGRTTRAAACYWEWMVNQGRSDGASLGEDYCEVHFEDLVNAPQRVLARLGEFLGQELDYDRILEAGLGTVSAPNTSFGTAGAESTFSPVGRWREHLNGQELADIETMIGGTLRECGYACEAAPVPPLRRAWVRGLRSQYLRHFAWKHWAKMNTPLGRILTTRDLSWL